MQISLLSPSNLNILKIFYMQVIGHDSQSIKRKPLFKVPVSVIIPTK